MNYTTPQSIFLEVHTLRKKTIIGLAIVLLPLLTGLLLGPTPLIEDDSGTDFYETENGELLEIGTDEEVYEYHLSNAPTQVSGTGDSLVASEYGNRTDSFSDEALYYDSSTQTTTEASLTVPMGEDWEGYQVFTNVTSITENRTWVSNSGFDSDTDWTWLTHDEPSTLGPYTNTLSSQWISSGGNPGGAARFDLDGYYHNEGGGLYGDWYDIGDKAYAVQNLTIDRGDVTSVGISLDYWADINWGSLTGFCEIFVSVGDPDNGGTYLWHKEFDSMAGSATWFSSGYVTVDVTTLNLPNVSLWVGLRTTALEWWRPDTEPQARVDNLIVYITAKAAPSDINLQMNGVDVEDYFDGLNDPIYGIGYAIYTGTIFQDGEAFANFTWTPSPNPPDPDLDINIALDADVTVWARRYNVLTINDTEFFTYGENYYAENSTDIQWETNHYAAIPGGYTSKYFFNASIPINRDVNFVAEPYARTTNLTSGWTYGDPGDGLVNISVYEITTTNQNGFWLLKGTSPNMINDIEVWDDSLSQWTPTHTFRANEDTRFRVTLSSQYAGDLVNLSVYSPDGSQWISLQAVVDGAGYAVSSYVNLDAVNASVGTWQVQAHCSDLISGSEIHNIGYYTRDFDIDHSSSMSVKYPSESVNSWTTNVTYGELVLLQVRVNDSDNGDLLAGGSLDYDWAAGTGSMSDLGTGEYSITLDTNDLSSNGQYEIDLTWTKAYFDSIIETFTLNVIYTTDLLSADAPGVDIPSGYNAEISVEFKDQTLSGITGATISCNWTDDFTITPDGGTPGKYLLSLETDSVQLDTYALRITAQKDFFESRSILLSIQVRELYTSAIPSTSLLSLPVGYTTSFTITYTDTDNNLPISGAASAISCNWSDIHSSGDLNYTVSESGTPGVYDVNIYSSDLDVLDSYDVVFNVERYGSQNHTFTVTVELRTHLTSFYLVNPVDPTPYTGNISIYVRYFDTDADVGIENGSLVGYNVDIDIVSGTLPGLFFFVENGTEDGEYVIIIPAYQWGSIGSEDLEIYANWTGPTIKYSNETIDVTVRIIEAPTDIFISDSPVMTPYSENVTFSIVYYDVGNDTGIVNGTGTYSGNVRIYVEVLTSGQSLTQQNIVITEVDFYNNPGEYSFEFNTSYLSGLIGCELRVWFNWTKGILPYYANQSLQLTVYSTYRLTTLEWTPLPLTAYDELVNLSMTYKDVLSGDIILNSPSLTITIPTYGFTVYYDGDATGIFFVEVDTSVWTPGLNSFSISLTWEGAPFYQNRTGISISITTRYRYTELTHGSYSPVQYGNNVTVLFSYRDLDDFTTSGMDSGTLTLDAALTGFYWVIDNTDGTYTLELSTLAFTNTGIFSVNASIVYGGLRYCSNATDSFFISITQRRAQLTSDLPDLAPYLTLANITVTYTDDNSGTGITGADLFASCTTATTELQEGVNYWIVDNGNGLYDISISTVALGTFGSYSITVIANWTGSPFYIERTRDIAIEVSRREARLLVTKSPLNTPYLENVTFEFTATDGLSGSSITLDKTNLKIGYGTGSVLGDSLYTLAQDGSTYTINFNSTSITTILADSLEISINFTWGDFAPYYSNASTSTSVTITGRSTQSVVLSTPPASYGFNMTAILSYSDYLSGNALSSALISVESLNESSIQSWWSDNADGTYTIRINSSVFSKIGKYFFIANITWVGEPYYNNQTNIGFQITLNPVATVLLLELTGASTNYLGDIIEANVSFQEAETGIGIDGADVTTDWNSLYGTDVTINSLGSGVYGLQINTSGLNAQNYDFSVSALKFIHQNKTIDISILLAAIPIDIDVDTTPESPEYGDEIIVQLNITNARTEEAILAGSTNMTILGDLYIFSEIGGGIYQVTLPASTYNASDYTISFTFEKDNHESRTFDSQLRIDKVSTTLDASLDPFATVNGDTVTITAEYLIQSNSTPIEIGTLTFSWVGGSGTLDWSSIESKYVGQFTVTNTLVGSYQILIQASSTNFRNLNTRLTLQINEIRTELLPYEATTFIEVIANDAFNLTIYLNNTDLSLPVTGANLTYSIGDIVGNMTELGDGYYTANISTSSLEIRSWVLSVTSSKDGFSPASLQFNIDILNAPTDVLILTTTQINVYYGQNATFRFEFRDTNSDLGIPGATATYLLSQIEGNLTDHMNGTYTMEIVSSLVSSSSLAYQISVNFQKEGYDFANGLVRLLVNPIPTQIDYLEDPEIPWSDDYTQVFNFYDTLNEEWIVNATRTVFWDFGTIQLLDNGNGSYIFGPSITDQEILPIGSYLLRVVLSKENYARVEITANLTIRPIRTVLFYSAPSESGFAGDIIIMNLTYWDLDHNVPISNALNNTEGTNAERLSEDEYQGTNGTYYFYFLLNDIGRYEIIIEMSSNNYDDARARVVIFAVATEEQIAAQTTFTYGAIGVVFLAALGALWFRVLSIPKMLRWIRAMISALSKGRIPSPKPVRSRRRMLHDWINEELLTIGLTKPLEDISEYTVEVETLDTEKLLEELAVVVGLTESDIVVLRRDLDKMKPSERGGFLNEVIRQERARRAKDIAETPEVSEEEIAEAAKLTEEELESLKQQLLDMGIEETEADLMIEQAKHLSKAEIDALLDQIGGMKE